MMLAATALVETAATYSDLILRARQRRASRRMGRRNGRQVRWPAHDGNQRSSVISASLRPCLRRNPAACGPAVRIRAMSDQSKAVGDRLELIARHQPFVAEPLGEQFSNGR